MFQKPIAGSMEACFEDILTVKLCNSLVSQLIKYILFNKQQLPCTFENLKYSLTRKSEQNGENKARVTAQERQKKITQEGVAVLELIFEKIESEMEGKGGKVKEVVLILGSTIMTPRQVYRIHIPDVYYGHAASNHSDRKNLLKLLHSMLDSSSLSGMLAKPLGTTNMYVMIRKSGQVKSTTETWFKPKQRFNLPKNGQHFSIYFKNPDINLLPCTCHGFKVFEDEEQGNPAHNSMAPSEDNEEDDSEESIEWFQAGVVFKGFKFMVS